MAGTEGQAARLQKVIENNKTNPKRFAQVIGVSPSFIYQILGGKKDITAKVISGVSRAYPNTNLTWLLEGVGEENLTAVIEKNLIGAGHKNDGPLQGLIDLLEKHERRIAELEGKMDYLLEKRRGDESKG